jgi:hypothetical protein
MKWYCLQYNDCPRHIFQAESLEKTESIRIKYQKDLDERVGYKTYYVYCFEVPILTEGE